MESERNHVIVEGAGAAALAVAMHDDFPVTSGKIVCVATYGFRVDERVWKKGGRGRIRGPV